MHINFLELLLKKLLTLTFFYLNCIKSHLSSVCCVCLLVETVSELLLIAQTLFHYLMKKMFTHCEQLQF